jgi:thiol-activated cytolysin
MKQLFKTAAVLALATMASCSKKDDATISSIEGLKPVDFVATPDKIVKTELSSKAYPNPANNQISEYQVITTTQKSQQLEPLSPSFDTKTELIYPGSILRGSSFLNANYDPLVLSNAFEKVTLSTSLKGAQIVAKDFYPTQSGIRTGINELVALQAQNLNYAFVPAIFNYDSKEVTTAESLVKSLNIHASLDLKFSAASVSAKFGFEKKETNTVDTHYVLISFRQKLYSASIDPKYYKDWIKGGINPLECGEYEPIYISSVDYGRTAYVLFETNLSTQQLYTKVTASLSASYGVATLNADTEFTTDAKKTFSENKFKAYIYGGPLNGNLVTDIQGLSDFLKKPTAAELVASSVPISYTVRRLKDNTEVAVRSVYTEESAGFKK